MAGKLIDWVRATGTEPLALNIGTHQGSRWYVFPSPVLHQDLGALLDYEPRSDLAVSITLYYTIYNPSYYAEGLGKQSMWFIKHLLERTDMIPERVGLRLGISSDMQDVMLPYLKAANFPEHLIDWFTNRECTLHNSGKFIHMTGEGFKRFDRVIHLDVLFQIDTHHSQYAGTWFRNLIEVWGGKPMGFRYQIWSTADRQSAERFDRHWGEHVPPDTHLLWRTLSKYSAMPPSECKRVFMEDHLGICIIGDVFGCSRSTLDSLNLENDIYPVMRVSNDELALNAYSHLKGWDNDDVADFHDAFNWRHQGHPIEHNQEYTIRRTGIDTNPDDWMSQYE